MTTSLSTALAGSPARPAPVPTARSGHQDRARQQSRAAFVVREHVSDVRRGREEQRRALEGARGASTPARADTDCQQASERAEADEAARKLAKPALAGSHRPRSDIADRR